MILLLKITLLIPNRNTKHNWQLQPITFSYYNKDKDVNPEFIVQL